MFNAEVMRKAFHVWRNLSQMCNVGKKPLPIVYLNSEDYFTKEFSLDSYWISKERQKKEQKIQKGNKRGGMRYAQGCKWQDQRRPCASKLCLILQDV